MKLLKIALFLMCSNASIAQKLSVYDLSCEHKTDSVGVDALKPRLSWKIKFSERQKARWWQISDRTWWYIHHSLSAAWIYKTIKTNARSFFFRSSVAC